MIEFHASTFADKVGSSTLNRLITKTHQFFKECVLVV
jgi:hypothetical protein